MTLRVRTLLAGPAALADPPERQSLLTPGLVVLAAGVAVAAQSVPMMAVAFADVTSHPLRFATGSGTVGVASSVPFNLGFNLAVAPVAWVALAAVTHAGARVAGGRGRFSDTLAAVGWCALPWAVVYALVVAVAVTIAATSDAALASVLGGHALEFVPSGPPAFFDGRGAFDLRAWLFAAGVALSARIWARAVPAVHGEGLARAASAVAAGVALLTAGAILV